MPLEVATHIASLVATNPAGLDDLSTADDHIRLLKDVLIRDLPLTTPATAIGISVLTAASAAAARSSLGSTATGDAVFVAASANAASDALGAFRRGTLLGTVSQTAGVPTGAVVERGSNANGEYVRFADGTQICTFNFGLVAVIANGMTQFTWAFPSAFAVTPKLSYSPGCPDLSQDVFGICRNYAAVSTYIQFGYRNGATAQNIANVGCTAIGRWF